MKRLSCTKYSTKSRLPLPAVGEIVGDTARQAGKSCGARLYETAKLNMKIFDLNTEIIGVLQKAGHASVRVVHSGALDEPGDVDPLLEEIDG